MQIIITDDRITEEDLRPDYKDWQKDVRVGDFVSVFKSNGSLLFHDVVRSISETNIELTDISNIYRRKNGWNINGGSYLLPVTKESSWTN